MTYKIQVAGFWREFPTISGGGHDGTWEKDDGFLANKWNRSLPISRIVKLTKIEYWKDNSPSYNRLVY